MADSVIAIADIVGRIISKVDEISSLPKECVKLRDVVQKLQPIYNMFSNQLQRPEQRDVMEMLYNALRKAEEVVDFISEHPLWVKARSSKYTKKLKDAMSVIDIWMNRVESFAMGENLNTVKDMRRDINVFCNELEQMKEEIIDKIDDLPNQMRKMLRDEMNGLMHHANKDSRFQSFIDDINDRNLLMALETSLAKDDGALDTFFCPITGDVMENPVMCIVSGNTYEASAIRKHFGNCVEHGKQPFDPLTNQIVENPRKELVPNRSLKDTIEEWKEKKSNHKYPDTSVFEMMEQNRLMKEKNDNDLLRMRNQLSQENALKEKRLKDELEQKRLSYNKKEQAMNEKLRKAQDDLNKLKFAESSKPKPEVAKPVSTEKVNAVKVKSDAKTKVSESLSKDITKSKTVAEPTTMKPLLTMQRETTHEKGWLYGKREIVVKDGHTYGVWALTVHGGFLYSGSGDKTIRKWDLSSNACVSVLKGHTDWVFALTVHGGFLYTGSYDKTIRKWNL